MRLVRYQARQSPRKLQSGVGGELAGRAGPSERLQITGFYALCESVNGLRWPCPPQERRYNSVSAHKPQFRIRTLLGAQLRWWDLAAMNLAAMNLAAMNLAAMNEMNKP